MRGIGFVVAEDPSGHIDGRKIVPNGNFPLSASGSHITVPAVREVEGMQWCHKSSGQGPAHKGNAVDIALYADQWQRSELWRELVAAGKFAVRSSGSGEGRRSRS